MGAWDRRISRLSDALAAFQRFERKHELLMRSVDFLSSETARLTRAFVSIAVDNGFLLPGTSTGDDLEMRYPELFVPKQDGNDNGTAAEPEPGPQGPVKTGALVIDVRASPDELSFVSADGTGRFKLGLTREGARLWLRLERAARKSVADRLSADRKERAALAAKTAAPALAGGSPSP